MLPENLLCIEISPLFSDLYAPTTVSASEDSETANGAPISFNVDSNTPLT